MKIGTGREGRERRRRRRRLSTRASSGQWANCRGISIFIGRNCANTRIRIVVALVPWVASNRIRHSFPLCRFIVLFSRFPLVSQLTERPMSTPDLRYLNCRRARRREMGERNVRPRANVVHLCSVSDWIVIWMGKEIALPFYLMIGFCRWPFGFVIRSQKNFNRINRIYII